MERLVVATTARWTCQMPYAYRRISQNQSLIEKAAGDFDPRCTQDLTCRAAPACASAHTIAAAGKMTVEGRQTDEEMF